MPMALKVRHRRRHAGGGEGLRPDRRALHAHLEALHLGQVAHRLVDEDVARAAAGVADQHDLGVLGHLVGNRLQQVGVEHLVPVRQVAEQERRVDERRGLGEGRHVGRRDDAVVDRLALRHVLEVLLLQAEFAVAVQDEVDRLAVVLLDQFLELQQGPVEGVVVAELHGAVQRDGLRLRRADEGSRQRRAGGECADELSALHERSPCRAVRLTRCSRPRIGGRPDARQCSCTTYDNRSRPLPARASLGAIDAVLLGAVRKPISGAVRLSGNCAAQGRSPDSQVLTRGSPSRADASIDPIHRGLP
jgi:hypothetical protein